MSSIYKQKKSRYFWIKYRDAAGRLIRKSLRTPHKGIAQTIQKNIDHEIKRIAKGQPATIQELADHFLATMRHNVSNNYYITTKSRLKKFLAEANVVNVTDINHPAIQAFTTSLSLQSKAPSTVRGYLWAISAFCEHAASCGVLAVNPCRRIKLPKIKKLPPRFLSDQDYEKSLLVAKEHGIYLEVLTALKTGMRMSEIRRMEWKDVHWKENLIIVPETKSNRPRSIPLHPELAAELHRESAQTGWIFKGVRGGMVGEKQWKELLKPLQKAIPAFTKGHKGTGSAWHLLRRTFAVRLAKANVSLIKIKEWMGHTSITTTMIYAVFAPDKYDSDILQA